MAELRRVLFTESSPNIGGQELQLLAQAKHLQQCGVDTLLVCRADSRIADVAHERGIAVEYVPFRNSLHPPSLKRMASLLRRYRPDAVIAHSGHDANTVAVAARLMRQRPLLVRARTYQPGVPNAWTYNILFDLTLVPSRYLKSCLLSNPRVKADKIQVLYPGINFEHGICPDSPVPDWLTCLLAAKRRIILHAAMLRGEKGHDVMLDALPKLLERFPDICYAIAGEGERLAALREKVRTQGLEQHVVFAGMVCNLPAIMQHAGLVVMPSSYEPLGMSQIEALGMQIPVIVSRTGGMPETVEDGITGLLANPDDAEDWACKLTQALSQPNDMQAMACAGKSQVRAQFSMAYNLEQLQKHLQAGLMQRSRKRFPQTAATIDQPAVAQADHSPR